MKIFIATILLCALPITGATQSNPLASLPPDTVVAILDGAPIRLSEVDAFSHIKDPKKLFHLNQQLFELREHVLNTMIGERLLAREAQRARMLVDDYVAALPAEPVDEKDVEALVADALRRNNAIDSDKLRALVRDHLRDQKQEEARRKHIEELKLEQKKGGKPIVMKLQPPRVRAPVVETDPVKGSGPIEIVEFSDFECPYCQKAQPILRELMARYVGKVKLVWKDFPLAIHRNAVPAAAAARCAHEQAKFWEYHDVLFANQHALNASDLRMHAVAAGLDSGKFDACIKADKHSAKIVAEVEELRNHPVEATPTFLINGRLVQGAVPLYEMTVIVEQELAN